MEAALSVSELIRRRRTVRSFKPDPVPGGILRELADLATRAPSSWNLQPWRIVVVTDASVRQALQRASYNQKQVGEAPATFVFAFSLGGWRQDLEPMTAQAERLGGWSPEYAAGVRRQAPAQQELLEQRGLMREFCIRDSVVAATQTALAAESFGLATCLMSGWQEHKIKAAIGAADDADLGIGLLLDLGYPERVPASPGRFPIRHTVSWNRFGVPFPDQREEPAAAS
jgi:nitroreductase